MIHNYIFSLPTVFSIGNFTAKHHCHLSPFLLLVRSCECFFPSPLSSLFINQWIMTMISKYCRPWLINQFSLFPPLPTFSDLITHWFDSPFYMFDVDTWAILKPLGFNLDIGMQPEISRLTQLSNYYLPFYDVCCNTVLTTARQENRRWN